VLSRRHNEIYDPTARSARALPGATGAEMPPTGAVLSAAGAAAARDVDGERIGTRINNNRNRVRRCVPHRGTRQDHRSNDPIATDARSASDVDRWPDLRKQADGAAPETTEGLDVAQHFSRSMSSASP
jgi:hypothetical protein